MKLLIILFAMLATAAGAFHSWQTRDLLVSAATYSEGLTLTSDVKLLVAEYFARHRTMPNDNIDLDLPRPKSLYGTFVRRIAVTSGGVVKVDFGDRIGASAMSFSPSVSRATGQVIWFCTSGTIDSKVLKLLRPPCEHLPVTQGSMLMHAIANEELVNIRSLLDSRVDLDRVVKGETPLMLAAKVGNHDIVEYLLKAGAKVDNPADVGERLTPLMAAITSNNAEVVALLLSRGASVTLTDNVGMSAMDHAVMTDKRLGKERFVPMVSARFNPEFAGIGDIETQNTINDVKEDQRLITLYEEYLGAAENCHIQRISSLLTEQKEFDASDRIDGLPLSRHIRKPECIGKLKDYLRAKRSFQQASEAHLASRVDACDVQAVERAFAENSHLNVIKPFADKAPLDRAINGGCYEVVRLFFKGTDLASHVSKDLIVKAITKAPQESLLKLVGALISLKADVNGVGANRQTPLAAAIALDQPVVAKMLIDSGASVDKKTPNRSYPVIEATKKGYEHLVLQMVAKGADLNARDAFGRTALFAAVTRGQQRLVQSLINAGANISVSDENGISPIMLAESRNLTSIKRVLVASR